MTDSPPEPDAQAQRPLDELGGVDFAEAGFVAPDPDEPPPVELWRAVGDISPWGTVLLLLSWGVVFAMLAARHQIDDSAAYLARGASLTQRDALDASWRLLASTFLHGSPGHLFFNALAMLVFGPVVERIFTRWGFWIVFAYGGAIASLGSLLWRLDRHGAGPHLSIGASGAIFALGGAVLAGAFRLRHRLAPGRARALAAGIMFFALPALAAGFQRLGTDNAAHAAGLLAGVGFGSLLPLSIRLGGRRANWLVSLLGVIAAIALGLTLLRVLRGA